MIEEQLYAVLPEDEETGKKGGTLIRSEYENFGLVQLISIDLVTHIVLPGNVPIHGLVLNFKNMEVAFDQAEAEVLLTALKTMRLDYIEKSSNSRLRVSYLSGSDFNIIISSKPPNWIITVQIAGTDLDFSILEFYRLLEYVDRAVSKLQERR